MLIFCFLKLSQSQNSEHRHSTSTPNNTLSISIWTAKRKIVLDTQNRIISLFVNNLHTVHWTHANTFVSCLYLCSLIALALSRPSNVWFTEIEILIPFDNVGVYDGVGPLELVRGHWIWAWQVSGLFPLAGYSLWKTLVLSPPTLSRLFADVAPPSSCLSSRFQCVQPYAVVKPPHVWLWLRPFFMVCFKISLW